jgi:hypothetical protein
MHDAWTQTKLVVDRPAGIRDASLVAIGLAGALPGARLSWILVDDILTEENTRTEEGRRMVKRWFDTTVLSRRDVKGSKIVVTNTAWHPDDLTYALEATGWPTLSMTADGDIAISNSPDFDSIEIRPSKKPGDVYRLAAHDREQYDHEEKIPLWPSRFSREVLDEFKRAMPAFEYDQLYSNKPRSESDSRCKLEWIELCKSKARERGVYSLAHNYNGSNLTVTGVDLGIGLDARHDKTAFFTFEILPDGYRKILDIQTGRWTGSEIIDRLCDITTRYNSICRVETNQGQAFLMQFAMERNASLLLRPHFTGTNKGHPEHGLEALFIELENGAWLIPNDPSGNMPEEVAAWCKECLWYTPKKHTADVLIATWLAREEARACGCGTPAQSRRETVDNIVGNIFAR